MRTVTAVLHCHSTWSYDGHWGLHRIARLWERLGADAVMMTEHDTGFEPARFGEFRAECAAASTEKCRLIPGIEYSSPENDFHILTWGLPEFLAEGRPTIDTLRDVSAAGAAAVFAHPIRRDVWRRYDPDWTEHLSAIEIWNRKSDGIVPGARAVELWQATGLAATAGPDFHKRNQVWPLMNRLEVEGADLEAGLVAALRAGRTTPLAFGRPVIRDGGIAPMPLSRGLERGRKVLRDIRNALFRR